MCEQLTERDIIRIMQDNIKLDIDERYGVTEDGMSRVTYRVTLLVDNLEVSEIFLSGIPSF